MVDIVSSRVMWMEAGMVKLLLHHVVVQFTMLGIGTSLVAWNLRRMEWSCLHLLYLARLFMLILLLLVN